MQMLPNIPLSLYIHIPWCVRKCPYCDFNSHTLKNDLPEEDYIAALIRDLDENLHYCQGRSIKSIFFGGGTPSLFSGKSIATILNGVTKRLTLEPLCEVTLEANPGTTEQQRFKDYLSAGVNRLSIGIQSLQDSQLKILGRIHDKATAARAVKTAQDAGFDNINVDIMFGLPEQATQDALQDLKEAIGFNTKHLSWYQLTLEPNTAFYHQRPSLPPDEEIWEMQLAGQQLLKESGFEQYEVSAYSKPNHPCQHNLNYWQFGDYLGIGAGAHSKITLPNFEIIRHWQVKNPRDYLDTKKNLTQQEISVSEQDRVFEFMLNALRLNSGFHLNLFKERTGLDRHVLDTLVAKAQSKKLIEISNSFLKPTELGKRFLNDLVEFFL